MSENTNTDNSFVGYEYRDITVSHDMESLYMDSYQNFGWKLDNTSTSFIGFSSVSMKFKRDRKIRNKAELTRLQRQFDACVNEIISMEKSKETSAGIVAITVGLIGTAFLAGATFSYLSSLIFLCVVLAIPGFVGWILPYFLHNATRRKRATKITPLIESKYDEIYEICERANSLLGNE